MSVYQRPADLARAQQRRFDAMALTQVKAHEELVQQGENDHKAYVLGGISSKALKAMGHPFARQGSAARGIVKNKKQFKSYGNTYTFQSTTKRGVAVQRKQQITRGKVDPLPINRQTGKLRSSYYRTRYRGKDKVVWMGFKSKHASAVLSPTGTKHMIYRGFYSRSKNTTNPRDLGIIARRHRARSAALIQSVRARQRKP
ncbi:MAG TPA: hypothetical protein VK171_01540 [Fimbriimonas sp.]|nr:hypothetical protein [Fimbriimonas sp.]